MKERVRWEGLLLVIFALFLFSGDKAWSADSTTPFPDPAQGDTVVNKDGSWSLWYTAGDYAQGQRTLVQAMTIKSVSYHMKVALNLLLGETANLSMFLNETEIGQFELNTIDTEKDVNFVLDPPITASEFTIKLLLTNTLTGLGFYLSPDAPGAITLSSSTNAGTIAGTVTEGGAAVKAAGDPIDGATVTVTNADGDQKTTTTDADGSYALESLTPGNWMVQASKEGYRKGIPMPAKVVAEETTTLDLTLTPARVTTGAIIGTVTDANSTAPLDGATVTAKNLQTGATVETITEADGAYEFLDLAKGLYIVRATMTGYKNSKPQVAVVTPGGEVTLDFGLTPKPAVKAKARGRK